MVQTNFLLLSLSHTKTYRPKAKKRNMGVTFRDGRYIRFVRLGGRTIKDGEAAAIWNRRGEHQEIIGPKRVLFWFSTVRFLTRFKAETHQYLIVSHRNGSVEHIQGPVELYHNPKYHDEIKIEEGIQLKENEVIQVSHMPQLENHYHESDTKKIEKSFLEEEPTATTILAKKTKRLVEGPTLFIPAVDESIEGFEWSHLPEELDGEKLESTSNYKFCKIMLHSNKVWNVKVPIGEKSKQVFALLSITHSIDCFDKLTLNTNPNKALASALMVDVQEIFQEEIDPSSDFSAFRDNVVERLSHSNSSSESIPFRNLVKTGHACGFCIHSANLLKVIPGSHFQRQMDLESNLEIRMKEMVRNKESQIELQELELEEERKKMDNKIELARKEAQMQADLNEELYIQKLAELDQKRELEKRKMQQNIDAWKASDDAVLEFLQRLKGFDVELTSFLSSSGGKKITSGVLERSPSLSPSMPKQEK